jgi:hypothetical protein
VRSGESSKYKTGVALRQGVSQREDRSADDALLEAVGVGRVCETQVLGEDALLVVVRDEREEGARGT